MTQLENAPAADRTDGAPRTSPLPDLSRTGLRGLRASRDPALAAAVRHVLAHPAELTEGWDDGSVGGLAGAPCGAR
ncbi:hypothetical protein [Streptomyces sp. NPDC049555]|uniref:hypothetical protein n=1 Tax=unclassified Streptomyces TaxID=2593676 RepID=UPI003435B7E1